MFSTKGRLKVTLFVVGFLVVGLGMYMGVQVQDAEATHSSFSCIFKVHKVVSRIKHSSFNHYTGGSRTKSTTCSNCAPCYPSSNHTQLEAVFDYTKHTTYKHRQLWHTYYSPCHTHTDTGTEKRWLTVVCNQPCYVASN